MAKKARDTSLPAAVKQAINEMGGLISTARKEKSWSQHELAERIGVGRMTVVRMEKGVPEVAIGVYLTAAWVLGLPVLTWSSLAEGRSDTSVGDLLMKLKRSLPQRVRSKGERLDNDF